MAGTVTLRFGLLELVRLEADAAPLIEYLVDLARSPSALEIVDDHGILISQEALFPLCMGRSSHVVASSVISV